MTTAESCRAHLHPRGGGPPKTAYRTRGAAQSAIRNIKARRIDREEHVPERAYRCRGCGRFFLTSSIERNDPKWK